MVGYNMDLIVCDAESGKLINRLEITDYEETDDGYIETDIINIQVIKDKICVPKVIVKNNEAVFQGMSIYDKELNLIKDIAVIADCLTYDGKSKLKFLYDNYPESESQTLYISDIESSNTKEHKLCQIPEQYELDCCYYVTDESFLYGMLTDRGQDNDYAMPMLLIFQQGSLL
ncbi:MAG: hypothetical protein K2K41_02975 [Ruminiclostridium sp.]|nr:hypothetical protein [Ruminiclostridium sp.]